MRKSPPTPELEEYLTTEEAASRLRVTPRRIRQLITDGALDARRIGGRGQFLIPETALVELLETVGEPSR